MIEKKGNIFDQLGIADAICITTNCMRRKNGDAICGAGLARKAVNYWNDFEKTLGAFEDLTIPHIVKIVGKTRIVTFPTKHDWREDSSLDLIMKSCIILDNLALERRWGAVALPRPGCGLGRLNWEIIGPMMGEILSSEIFCVYS